MITILFPPGCYGTYFAQCIYNYTELRQGPLVPFIFSSTGNSHSYRNNIEARQLVRTAHPIGYVPDSDSVITILPDINHRLDYYNNQFFKQQNGDLIGYVKSQFTQTECEAALANNWGYTGPLDNAVPRWIIREWCSYWLQSVLDQSYNCDLYTHTSFDYQLNVLDIFNNFETVLVASTTAMGLTINVDQNTIDQQHKKFLSVQPYHNSQIRCHQAVDKILRQQNSKVVTHSLFDEAYIQHLLRQRGFELCCNNLNIFPSTTQHIRTLLNETSNNSN